MIRVLHVLNSLGVGGIETFLMNVYRVLDREDFQFDFLVHEKKNSYYEHEVKDGGGRIFYLPTRREGILKVQKELNTFFCSHPEYQIVHEHVSSLSDIDALISARRNGVKGRIIHAHSTAAPGSKIHKLLHMINKCKVRKIANYYFSCSDAATRWLYSGTGIKDIEFVPNGIDCTRYVFDENIRKQVRKKLGIDEKKTIIHIGRMSYEKNHMFLLDVFSKVHKMAPNSSLLLVGDGVLKDRIKQKISDLNLDDSVYMIGVRQDIPELLMAADVFVLPSIFEGFPVSIIEAQATGIPCLYSNNVTSLAKITKNTQQIDIGLDIWASEIINMFELKRDYDANNTISQSEYNIRNVANRLCTIYKSILG